MGPLLHSGKYTEVAAGEWEGKPAVIKRIAGETPDRERSVRRLVREAAAHHRITHPGVVRLLAVEGTLAEPELVFERLEGPSLRQLLKDRGRLEPVEVAKLVAPIAQALAHIHSCGLVHADVKPGNVVMHHEQPVLVDFDLAREPGQLHSPLGTRLFAAPECARGERLGFPADVWGLGVVAFRAATGQLPFNGEGRPQISDPPPRAETDAAFAGIIAQLLAPEPADRPICSEVTRLLRVAGRRDHPE